MGFMERQIVKGDFYEVETTDGTVAIPVDIVGVFDPNTPVCLKALEPYLDCDVDKVTEITLRRNVYGARLSAPGYTDCTDWTIHTSKRAAEEYLRELE